MKRSHRTSLAALLLILTSIGCSDDDDNPTAANSPCLDANTECASLSVQASDMVFSESYDDETPPGRTDFQGKWPASGDVVAGYGPGKHMIVSVRFNPPLIVRYDIPLVRVFLQAGVESGAYNRFANVTPQVTLVGNWGTPSQRIAAMEGSSTDGSSRLAVTVDFLNLEAGQSLHSLTLTFDVPNTYTGGSAAGSPILPGDLDVITLGWSTPVPGDERGNPPIWPGEFP